MTKQNLGKIVRAAQRSVQKHSPEILLGFGIAGMFTAGVLAVKGTPKALRLMEERKQEEGKDKLTAAEVVKTTWKCYIPAVVTAAVSTGCLIGSSSVSARRNAALATAYQISQTALTEYKDKVVETVGEKKVDEIRNAIAKDKIEQRPITTSEVYVTKNGTTRFFEPLSARYFESDVETVKKAVNDVNATILNDIFGYASLNELYDELNIARTGIGDLVGWNVHNRIKIHFSAQIADDGQPVLVLVHDNEPRYDYAD